MKFLKVILMIKNMMALNARAKARNKNENAAGTSINDVKHPAEFLVRW